MPESTTKQKPESAAQANRDSATPRPWVMRRSGGYYVVGRVTPVSDADLEQVALLMGTANASLIVSAVNAHDELLAACKYALSRLELADEGMFNETTLPLLRAAIAAAEGRA